MSNDILFENNSEQPKAQIGSQLKEAREKLDLTILDIARQLRLKPERIDELERDDYQAMPGTTFIKGYLRAYAQLVNLPADNLVALFEQLKPSSKIRAIPLVAKLHTNSLQEKPIRWGLYVVGLGLLMLMAIWWNSFSSNDATTNANTGMPHQPLPNEPTSLPTAPAANTPQTPPQAPATQTHETAPTVHTDMAHAGGMAPNDNPANTSAKTTANSAMSSDTASVSHSQNAAAAEDTEPTRKKFSKKSKRKRFTAQDENTIDTIDNEPSARFDDAFE
jgi:cytoskeletal protein RodZ